MKILVVGGGGYLGSSLIGRLLDENHEVTVIDKLMWGESGVFPYRNKITVLRMDAWELKSVEEYDVVIHLAGLVGEALCKDNEEVAKSVNSDLTAPIVKMCNDANIPLIFSSTCSNYGVSKTPANEETKLIPLGVYAHTKAASERWIQKFSDNYTILRLGTLFGVSPRMRLDTLVNQFVYEAWHDHAIEVYTPEAYRPIIHVQDACTAIISVLGKRHREVYNVAGYNVTKGELAEQIASYFLVPPVEVITVDKGDKRDYLVDFTKMKELGITVEYTIEQGISEVMKLCQDTRAYLLAEMKNYD